MIKHIVLFKLQEFENEAAKEAKQKEIKLGLEKLENIIPELKSIEVGINSNPEENFDIALSTTFNSMEDLATYAKHPDHLAVSKILRAVLESRSCVDFEI
ncbi:Dabb family protein [Carboxylicivirga sp. N1Y90]|uniref:Dabb family protein n=1 Tax=Carboxylicivirga fragile TaxID=3417571 RepID=UPI003D346A50|nr:Dabb family protein [Marinilabiliaceae bacterium N1Y90]